MEDQIEVVRRSYLCAKNGDLHGFAADFAEDICWVEMKGSPYAGIYRGAGEILAHVFEPMNRSWTPFACEPQEFYAAGNTVLVVGRYFGTNHATGKSFDARMVHLWRLEAGKITSFEQFTDTRRIFESLKPCSERESAAALRNNKH